MPYFFDSYRMADFNSITSTFGLEMPGPPRFESRKLVTLRRAEEDEFCTVVLPAIAMFLAEQKSSGSEMVVIRERLNWKSHAERLLLEGEFKQYYRMSFSGFERLLGVVGGALALDALQSMRRARGQPPLSPASMLQACISWLAGGSYHHIRIITGTSRAGFYRVVHAVIKAINSTRSLAIKFPVTDDEMEMSAAGFRSISICAIPGCIGAIDGWLCPIRVPRANECGRVIAFFSGHYQRYGLNVQACADYKCRFTAMACRAPGGRNDSVAFLQWSLSQALKAIQGPYFVVADNAYPQTRVVLTPFTQPQLKNHPERDNYNFYLSQCRIRIEMAFGLLVNKWRILKKPLCVRLKNAPHIIHACMRLHNFCINQHAIEKPDTVLRETKALRRELRSWNGTRDLSYSNTQYETEGGDVVELLDGVTRDIIVRYIEEYDFRRPVHNIIRRIEMDKDL